MKRTAETILDELLVLRAQSGDRNSLETLVTRHQARLLRLALLRVADADAAGEIVQETWISVVKGIGRLSDPAKFPAWVDQMVRFKSVDWLRRKAVQRKRSESIDPQESNLPVRDSAESDMQQREMRLDAVRVALKRLPDSQRQLLSLLYLEGKSVHEIATMLEIAAGTVKSRLFHARAALRTVIEDGDPKKPESLARRMGEVRDHD